MSRAKTSSEIRAAFLDFFRSKGHEIVPSAELVPRNDPTLMFTNAGMVPFKDIFTGNEKRAYSRAASSQKCIRISGKHNDLENVGRTARHHTFFEMLGNFSFGDYFKEEAIVYAWELLTRVLEVPKEKMCITYFGGEEDIPADEEAKALWRKVSGFGDDRIVGMGMADNFWTMGDTGPSGPCSEIYYFHGDGEPDPRKIQQEPSPDGSGWVEIWNLVFMQFERFIEDGEIKMADLPARSIDTGAGLERLASVLQGVKSNYDTDLLRPLVEKAASIANKSYGGTMSDDDVSMRVIADHARTAAFLISEGILPDRTGREYVLRRVMRRAVRHGHRLGIKEPFLHEVALEVVNDMGNAYPGLIARRDLIASITEQEERRFRQTIDRGLKVLDEELSDMRKASRNTLSGKTAFRLYDTYGFPLDLTEVICEEKGVEVDIAGYEEALEEARARSEFVGREGAVEQVYREALEEVPGKEVRFVGYEREEGEATVVALIHEGKLVDKAPALSRAEVILDTTPFYGEAGGQVGDKGKLSAAPFEAHVVDTQKPIAGLVSHHIEIKEGELAVGMKIRAEVDHELREATRRNHSATHLLHFALRRVLGEQAQQKGSLVGPDRLRFDFTSGRPMTRDEIRKVEDLVNEKILLNAPVTIEELSMEEAQKAGAIAIFEEKYGDKVRVLTMTEDSIELCGGTHARATGEIGMFKVLSETGIAAGVRRIEAATGWRALNYVRELETTLDRANQAVRAGGDGLVDKIERLVEKERELEREIASLQRKVAMGGGGGVDALLARAKEISGVKVLGARAEISDAAALREMAEQLRDKLGEAIVLIGAAGGDKVQFVLTVSKGLTKRVRAGDLIRPIAKRVGGSGGGRPDMAQAGGTDIGKLDEAIESLYEEVKAALDD